MNEYIVFGATFAFAAADEVSQQSSFIMINDD